MTGAEILPYPEPSIQDLTRAIVQHALAVRRLPGIQHAKVVVVIERNSILVARSVEIALGEANLANSLVMRESNKRGVRDGPGDELRAGTLTTWQSKAEAVENIRSLLEAGALQIHPQCTLGSPELRMPGAEPTRDTFVQQMMDFKCETVLPKGKNAPYQRAKQLYSGRHAGGGKASDDLVMATCFVMLKRDVFHTSPLFMSARAC